MNTYDFDETIFNPDSSLSFVLYCLRRYPAAWKTLPKTAWTAMQYAAGRTDTKRLKEQIFSFLRYLDADEAVEAFWRKNGERIESWYLKQKRADDVIISASPEFLLAPICARLGVRLIATRMDKRTGKIDGLNCHDSEKVRRFYEQYPGAHTECFYSDSLSDTPMAQIADRAFLVKKSEIKPWPGKQTDAQNED